MTFEDDGSLPCNDTIPALKNEILTRTRLYADMIRQLSEHPAAQPLELAGFLEDIANIYLSISEELTQSGKKD